MQRETELGDGDLMRIERRLKTDLARRMAAIQKDRSAGPAGGRNVGNAREYVMHSRTLRRVLTIKGRQNYVPLRETMNGAEWVPDEVAEAAEIDGSDTVAEVCEKIHSVANPHFDPESMTDHQNVPGTPSA